MGNHPSIFVKTPEEHIDEEWESTYERIGVVKRIGPRSGHVRVNFYSNFDHIWKNRDPSLQADIPLLRSGDLDIGCVIDHWGLERCMIIDPLRLTVFTPGNPQYLSAVAIKVLTEYNQHIKIIEAPPSAWTLRKRALRKAILHLICLYRLAELAFETRTDVPRWYRLGRQKCVGWKRSIDFFAYRIHSTRPRPQSMTSFYATIFACFLLFIGGLGAYLESVYCKL